MTTLVIGDVHGCYVELQTLLDKAGLGDNDRLLAVGDIVDRGPETLQVLDFFQSHANAHTLMGNHERKHVRAARGEIQLALSQRISQFQLADRYAKAVNWMSALPLFAQMQEAIVVHGFLEPGLSLTEQLPSVLCGTLGGAKALHERYDRPWYELYDGEQPVIMGHQNYTDSDQPFIYQDRVFGLDTSCVTGKSLTGILLPSFRIVSVPSRGNLWERVRRDYGKMQNQGVAQSRDVWSEADEVALAELVGKVGEASKAILSGLGLSLGFDQLEPRLQAKKYADMTGSGTVAILVQLSRVGELNLESARKVVRHPAGISEIAKRLENLLTG
jgi:Calcineurin-like phosphoesterase